MGYKVLRFLGAIVAAYVFSFLVDFIHLAFFSGAAHFFGNLSWSNWFSFDLLRGFLLPIAWSFLGLIGMGIVWLVRGSKVIAVLPMLWFLVAIIADFFSLFVNPAEQIIDDIGQGFWYYVGATLIFIAILTCYVMCAVSMFVSEKIES